MRAQQFGEEREQARMVAGTARERAIFQFARLQSREIFLDQPGGLFILDRNGGRTLEPLVAVQEIEAGVAALVDPEAFHGSEGNHASAMEGKNLFAVDKAMLMDGAMLRKTPEKSVTLSVTLDAEDRSASRKLVGGEIVERSCRPHPEVMLMQARLRASNDRDVREPIFLFEQIAEDHRHAFAAIARIRVAEREFERVGSAVFRQEVDQDARRLADLRLQADVF